MKKTTQLAELAWGIIANAHGGNWDLATPEWRGAAERWRDAWLASRATPTPMEEREMCAVAARVAHEVNRAYCLALGDTSQRPWDDAPAWQRESAIAGINNVWQRIKDALPVTPEASHESWMAHKLAEGWTHGPAKDVAAKTHPCLVPYDQLPPEQRMKDHLFIAVAVALREGA